jgi:NitT/TauT family transport system ATP-binding protein
MTGEAGSALVCRGISKTYTSRRGDVRALSDISFSVREGEFLSLVGPSGCGKSTLLKIIAGLVTPTNGQVSLPASRVSSGLSQPANAMVFQEHGLFPWMTVADNVAFGLEMQGVDKVERRSAAGRFLTQVGLGDFARHYPHELSVGMRQRAAIARAFLADPQVLLMDEPFSALDAQSKVILQEELLRIWKDYRKTVVYVTHDIEEAVVLADRVLVMSGSPGRILEEIHIPLDRPRDLQVREQSEFREIKWHIWKAIEGEVRRRLRVSS